MNFVVDRPVRLVLIGSPGAGKGTLGARLGQRFGVPHLSTGQLLRSMVPRNAEQRRIKNHILDGGFATDEVMLEWMAERLQRNDCENGYVLDGFPRTRVQAESFHRWLADRGDAILAAIHLDVSEAVCLERLRSRRSLEGRRDDREAVLAKRMRLDTENLLPLVEFYDIAAQLVTIDGAYAADVVERSAVAALRARSSVR